MTKAGSFIISFATEHKAAGVKTKQSLKQRLQRLLIRCSLCWGYRIPNPRCKTMDKKDCFFDVLVRLPISWTSSIVMSSHRNFCWPTASSTDKNRSSIATLFLAMGYGTCVCFACQFGVLILVKLVLCRFVDSCNLERSIRFGVTLRGGQSHSPTVTDERRESVLA